MDAPHKYAPLRLIKPARTDPGNDDFCNPCSRPEFYQIITDRRLLVRMIEARDGNDRRERVTNHGQKGCSLTLFDRRVFGTFVKPGEVVEVRILKASGKSQAWGDEYARGAVSGYFDDFETFCKLVKLADKATHGGIYFTLQVIDPRLIGRAYNRLHPSDVTTSDNNVIADRWLPVDLDSVRPSGVSSSDSELAEALELRDVVAEWVVRELVFPSPIRAMSGNGGHLLFRLSDMPANDETRQFIKGTLEMLAARFNTDKTHIDTTVHNPARIWKLYGTTSRKGDEVPAGPGREARPHRMACIDDMGHNQ